MPATPSSWGCCCPVSSHAARAAAPQVNVMAVIHRLNFEASRICRSWVLAFSVDSLYPLCIGVVVATIDLLLIMVIINVQMLKFE
jgi:hypothetical protein